MLVRITVCNQVKLYIAANYRARFCRNLNIELAMPPKMCRYLSILARKIPKKTAPLQLLTVFQPLTSPSTVKLSAHRFSSLFSSNKAVSIVPS